MSEDKRQKAYASLLDLASQQGYATVDNIIASADEWELTIEDVDWLSNSISTRGILIYDKDPEDFNKVDESEYSDYAQIDYDVVFRKAIELEPSLKPFIDEIRSIRPPQFRELNNIIYQAKEGNEYARNRIVEMHLRMTIRLGLQRAEQYDTNLVDCIGDACVGLINAIDKYDPDANGAFASYASLWMLQNMSREQKTQRPDVYYPVHKKDQYFIAYPILKDKGCTSCEKVWTCSKLRSFVQRKFDCTDRQTEDVILQTLSFDSLDVILDAIPTDEIDDFEKDDNRLTNRMIEKFMKTEPAYLDVESASMKEAINSMMNILTERERRVIKARFGFDNGREKTLEEIGAVMGITRERVRQIEAKAIRKLSQPSCKKKLKGYV